MVQLSIIFTIITAVAGDEAKCIAENWTAKDPNGAAVVAHNYLGIRLKCLAGNYVSPICY